MKGLTLARKAPMPAARQTLAAQDHPLFKRYALGGQASLSIGQLPTPYHVYDGRGVLIGGTVDLGAARELLRSEQVLPVQTDRGKALMGIWAFDFSAASLGAHHELQCSIFVSRTELAPVTSHRLGLLELMLDRPDVQMLCHGLWNSTATAVAYNRELLALDARLSDSRIESDRRAFDVAVRDVATQTTVLEASLHAPQRASLGASVALISRLGPRRLLALARAPWIRVPVINPVGPALPRNAAAESFTKAERSVLRYFDARRDRLVIGDERYRPLQFEPQFVQYMDGFKFVYLFPQ